MRDRVHCPISSSVLASVGLTFTMACGEPAEIERHDDPNAVVQVASIADVWVFHQAGCQRADPDAQSEGQPCPGGNDLLVTSEWFVRNGCLMMRSQRDPSFEGVPVLLSDDLEFARDVIERLATRNHVEVSHGTNAGPAVHSSTDSITKRCGGPVDTWVHWSSMSD